MRGFINSSIFICCNFIDNRGDSQMKRYLRIDENKITKEFLKMKC